MKKHYLILLQIILSVFLVYSFAFAAPSINGSMDSDWTGYQTVEDWVGGGGYVGPGYGGQNFDIEKIGLYIDDSKLYFGLQTGFDITGDNEVHNLEGGDIALDFGSDGSFEFGFDYSIDSTTGGTTVTTVSLYQVDSWLDPTYYKGSKPWKMDSYDHSALASTTDGSIEAVYGYSKDNDGDSHHTLEASVDLSVLANKLEALNVNGYSFDNATVHWTMECGNDILENTMTKHLEYNPTPEPATLLLFGMGLIGAGAFGRKKFKKERA
jgi:hypothetical protein